MSVKKQNEARRLALYRQAYEDIKTEGIKMLCLSLYVALQIYFLYRKI